MALDLRNIRKQLREAMDADNKMCPLLVRLTWHSCATYDKFQNNGGANGGTLRFKKQREDPENNGLDKAYALMEKIKESDTTGISYADLYILGGYEAIAWSGGPVIPFRTGREDYSHEQAIKIYGSMGCPFGDGKYNPNKSRLPAADIDVPKDLEDEKDPAKREVKIIEATRNFFARLNMNDDEAVALTILGHQYGGASLDNSGYEGDWFVLGPNRWNVRAPKDDGGYLSVYRRIDGYQERQTAKNRRQYQVGPSFMLFFMLPADMALYWDESYRNLIEKYDKDRTAFFDVATRAWVKMTEQGCPPLTPEMIYPVELEGFLSLLRKAFSRLGQQIREGLIGNAFRLAAFINGILQSIRSRL